MSIYLKCDFYVVFETVMAMCKVFLLHMLQSIWRLLTYAVFLTNVQFTLGRCN